MKRNKKIISFCLLLLMLLSACSNKGKQAVETNDHSNDTQQQHLFIAAASLEQVMEDQIIPKFVQKHPNVTIEGNYDSSGKLQTQIENGLATDIFFSAATKQMDALVEQNLIVKDSIVPLLQNQLVMIVPSDSTVEWHSFEDLLNAKSIAIGDPESVPAGQYAEKGLKALGIWSYVKEHASLGTNVTEVLNWVKESSAQVGLVYATDAASTDQVKIVATLPETVLNEPIIYPIGIVETSKEKTLAKEFIQFMASQEVVNVFEDAGFIMNE